MTDDDRVWRDEERTPLAELQRAMGSPAQDGQVDDVTGEDAGSESAFGHGPAAADGHSGPSAGSREATDEERANRPSTTGRTGPN